MPIIAYTHRIFFQFQEDFNVYVERRRGWLVGCRLKSIFPLMGPGTIGCRPCMGAFLRDPSPYLREFKKKTRKTVNGKVYKRDRKSDQASPA